MDAIGTMLDTTKFTVISSKTDALRRMSDKLKKSLSQEKLEIQQGDQMREGKVVLESTKNLTVVTTDFGVNGDDQKAVLGLIERLKVDKGGKEIAFIVSGPHPDLAAAAIAQKYHHKTGRYPLIATGKQHEQHLVPKDRIYSLVDGEPIENCASSVDMQKVSLEEFQRTIDAKIKDGNIEHFTQVVIAPLHSKDEYYNPSREKIQNDIYFHDKWKKIQKTSITQFKRNDNNTYEGNNYQKSNNDVANDYVAHLQSQNFQQVYFDGAVAKSPEFLLTMIQPKQPGIQKTIENYIATMQVPWLNMTEPVGTTPSPEKMHVGMFTSSTEVPFGVHVSGANPAGFGAERIMREVYSISPQETERYTTAMKPIVEELDTFDQQVLAVLQKQCPDINSVPDMRKKLHSAMMHALQEYAKAQKIINADATVQSFKDLFKLASAKGTPLNAYTYMKGFKKVLFESSALTKEITDTADVEKTKKRKNGESHVETMTNALGDKATAVVYDAVAIVAGRVVLRNEGLRKHFTEAENNIINVTPARLNSLREKSPDLYQKFVTKVKDGLAKDGCQLAHK